MESRSVRGGSRWLRSTASALVILGLLAFSLGVTGLSTSRAQPAPPIDSLVLVTDRIIVGDAADALVSAATFTVLADQVTERLTTLGTAILLVETGEIRIETDTAIPGLSRDADQPSGSMARYTLTTGQRLTFAPAASFTLRNDGTDPVRIFLLTFVVD